MCVYIYTSVCIRTRQARPHNEPHAQLNLLCDSAGIGSSLRVHIVAYRVIVQDDLTFHKNSLVSGGFLHKIFWNFSLGFDWAKL